VWQPFTTARTTEPDLPSLRTSLHALDASAEVQHPLGTNFYVIRKATAWTAPQIATAQNVLDTSPASSPQLTAQDEIDHWPISVKALVFALIDQLNVLGQRVTPPVPAITPTAALAAIKAKAGQP
jgi:hypothetical protein